MVRIKMLKSAYNGWEGIGSSLKLQEKGQEYELPKEQAEAFVSRGYAVYVEEPVQATDSADAEDQAEDLSELTVSQLKALAADRGISLTATRKGDIIAEIEAAQGA